MQTIKAKKSFSHGGKMYHCGMYELVVGEDVPKFNPITVKFESTNRRDTRFSVEDEVAGEIFEETITYATSTMPRLVVEAVQKILAFYKIQLDTESTMYLKELAQKCISTAEGHYGSRSQDHEKYGANSLLMISDKMKYHPIHGML